MQSTTPLAIRNDAIVQIKAIVPAHTRYRSTGYRYVRVRSDVPGPAIRNFAVELSRSAPVDGGIYGHGIEHQFEMKVFTSYGHLSAEDDDSVISEDGRQMWITLQRRIDPAVPGLISVLPSDTPWETESDEDGHVWGAHNFIVRYLASHLA